MRNGVGVQLRVRSQPEVLNDKMNEIKNLKKKNLTSRFHLNDLKKKTIDWFFFFFFFEG